MAGKCFCFFLAVEGMTGANQVTTLSLRQQVTLRAGKVHKASSVKKSKEKQTKNKSPQTEMKTARYDLSVTRSGWRSRFCAAEIVNVNVIFYRFAANEMT